MDCNYHRKKIPSNFDKFLIPFRIVLVFQTKTSFQRMKHTTPTVTMPGNLRNERDKNKLERIDKRAIICNINSTRVS